MEEGRTNSKAERLGLTTNSEVLVPGEANDEHPVVPQPWIGPRGGRSDLSVPEV